MDELLLQHKASYLSQIATFNQSHIPLANKGATPKAPTESLSDSDTVIGGRIRPLSNRDDETGLVPSVIRRQTGNVADVHELKVKVRGPPAVTTTSFNLDKLYGPESTSDDIYDDLCGPLLPWAWGGGISTLFAYGQTGSGKTFTLDALERRAAKDLFGGLPGNREVYVSIFDLAGNIASDLLNDRRRISVMQDSFGESQLVGALEPRVSSADELLEFIERSMTFRKSAPTMKNDSSSRTHAVCRIRIVNTDVSETPDGLLFLIDLAGSEAAADTKEHSKERMKESREINVSLSTLKDCIRGRILWYIQQAQNEGKGKPVHIPYQHSTLTKVLKHVFDTKGHRHCKTAVIACSGDPPIQSSLLAPTENGIQICRLPKGEFVSRCLETPGVTEQQARAFYDKLWCLHIDSRKITSRPMRAKNADLEPIEVQRSTAVPFQERIRPGMFIERKRSSQHFSKFMIMCPSGSFMTQAGKTMEKTEKITPTGIELKDGRKYTCSIVLPSPMVDAYELDVTRHCEIAVDEMDKEILMEYDPSSRCYYMTI